MSDLEALVSQAEIDFSAAADAVAEPPSAAAAAAATHVLKATTVHELCLVECVMRWEVALRN